MIELRVRGIEGVNRELERLARGSEEAAFRALSEEAEIEMTEAKRRTPVLTGALKSSGRVVRDRPRLAVELQFGDAAVGYALYVHENLRSFHKVGQAKFLESVLRESVPYFVYRVGKRMREILRSG